MNRRLILSIAFFIAIGVSLLTGVAVFGVGFLTPASARDLPAIRISELRDGQPVRVSSKAGTAYVVRLGNAVTAFSAIAPTINRCPIHWYPNEQVFNDASCLGVQFDVRGQYLSGPATRNLDRLPIDVRDGWVTVDTRTVLQGE